MEKVFENVLYIDTLAGRRDCTIYFVTYSGRAEDIWDEAKKRGITLCAMNKTEFKVAKKEHFDRVKRERRGQNE